MFHLSVHFPRPKVPVVYNRAAHSLCFLSESPLQVFPVAITHNGDVRTEASSQLRVFVQLIFWETLRFVRPCTDGLKFEIKCQRKRLLAACRVPHRFRRTFHDFVVGGSKSPARSLRVEPSHLPAFLLHWSFHFRLFPHLPGYY